jgi:RecB family exonuclease
LFRSWCGAARRRLVLAYARLDPVTGAQCLPSPLVLELAEEREGRSIDYESLESLAWVERVPLRRTALPDNLPVLGLDELDTAAALGLPARSARQYVRGLGDCARRGWMLDHLRNHVARFTSVDGMLSGRAARAALAARFARPSVSASQLANFSSCPFRYFLRYLLRIELLDRDDGREISGLEVGRLAHRILERFFTDLDRDGRTLQETDDTELAARVHTAQTPVFLEAEQHGRTGARLLWSIRKQRLEEDLRQFLRAERLRGGRGFRPLRFEARFGRGTPWPASLRAEDGQTIFLHGSIDRVDEDPRTGAIRVIDYKTGKLLSGGRDPGAIQLALYLWAATGGDPRRLAASEGQLASVTRRGGFALRRLHGAELLERRRDLERLAAGLIGAGRAGHFLPVPGPDAANCKICDYASLCEARVAEQVARKADDARMGTFLQLPDLSDMLETLSAGEADLAGDEGDDG